MATQREAVIALAKKELGYKESSNGWTKFGQWYAEYMHCENQGFENADWCAMFCAWCMQKAGLTSGQTVFTASAGPTGEALWKNKGLWKNASYTPKVGDLIHFTWGHVGLVEKVSGNTVHTIEGNYSNTV
ncbi:MAG: CHAP domain-containing protein, partial [Acutalibacteraceae bacterium]|nr:CHAP domain-containing protein [Acutalibacteraceae bacterium]